MATHPRSYSARETLRDGTLIDVREIRPDDKSRLLEHFGSLSVRSSYFRFFIPKRTFSQRDLAAFTELDFVRGVALVATVAGARVERIVGLAHYVVADGVSSSAVLACSVTDEYQGRGIGAVLLEHLLRFAREHGIDRFEADVLGDNEKMLGLFEHSGLAKHRSVDSGVVHVTFSGEEVDHFLAAA
jgi:GNAT superfamily N-acetyltransferase